SPHVTAAHATPPSSARERISQRRRSDRREPTAAPRALDPRLVAHRPALAACARRLLGSTWEAEAVVEEALASASDAMALFRPSDGLGGWLQGLVVGATLTRLRSASRAAEPPWPGPLEEDVACVEDGGDGLLEKALADPEQRTRVEELSALLPVPVRALFVLVDLERLELDRAASLLGV